jgi:hypothetical protein
VDTGLRRQEADVPPSVLDEEVHRRLGVSGRFEGPEKLRRRRPAGPRAGRRENEGADDDLAPGLLGEEQERRPRGHLEDGVTPRGVQDALGAGPAEPADPRQLTEEGDLVGRHALDGFPDDHFRRLDENGMALAELEDGGEFVEACPGLLDPGFIR